VTRTPPPGPLRGILVVDLTRVLAGPFCTMVLSDLGARVIKVEAPGRGDDARRIGPFVGGRSAYFMSLNRGKESIALDLRDDADRRGLVLASTSGFGQTGPYAGRPAYDIVVQAMGGIMSLTGHPGGPPTRVGSSVGDITAGLFTAIGVLAALHERGRGGCGTRVDVAMLDAQVATLENAVARYVATGEVPGPLGSRHPSIAPFEALATKRGHVVIAAGNDALFAKLCQALGRPELARDARFTSNEARTQNVDELTPLLEAALASRSAAEWREILEGVGVPCGPVNDVAALLDDPQVAARNMVVPIDDPAAGGMKVAGNPIKLSGFDDPATRGAVPEIDADRERILSEFDPAGG
jgi:CoA:oxalate CoA-transferase